MVDPSSTRDLLELTAQIVTAHVSNNGLEPDRLPPLIQSVYRTLAGLGNGANGAEPGHLVPAVPVNRSVSPDHLVCLEDGKKLKMLKRHLKAAYNLTPDEYRRRWGLPADYPMIAPKYAEYRSSLAKQTGLGTRGRNGR